MRKLISTLTLLICGCTTSGYQQFYSQYSDPYSDPNIEGLPQDQEPQLYGTNDFRRDIRLLQAKKYVVVGESSFNGAYEDTKNALAQAKRVGASIVLVKSEYTDTQTSTSALFVPNTQTTYHSGNLYSSSYSANYSGTSVSHGTSVVPYTTHQRRYDQNAVYLARLTKKIKFGVVMENLTREQKVEIERNTGAFVDIVIEDTPAFFSNLLPGDIVLEIDGVNVKSGEHAVSIMSAVPDSAKKSELTIVRKGEVRQLIVDFTPNQ